MLILDQDSFKKQIKILYYSKMPQVAQAFFENGFRDTTIASSLLVPVAAVKRWRELYKDGQLLENAQTENSAFPFDQTLGKLAWTDFPYDIKRVAKAFFEMGLRARAIAFYLDVPISTVYFWYGLFKKNQFETEPPRSIEPYQALGEKFMILANKRKAYSYEMRQAAKACFIQGMTVKETQAHLGIHYQTVYHWMRQFVEGSFYVNEKEKMLLSHARQVAEGAPSLIDRRTAKDLFDVGATEKEIAATLKLSIETVHSWNKLYKRGEFNDDVDFAKQIPKEKQKTATGYYTEEVRWAAKECFDRGYGYKLTATCLGIEKSATKEWKRLYNEGRFFIKK